MSTIDDHEIVDAEPSRGYGLSGQIMLTAIVLLFVVVVLMVGIHLYARWYIIRLRRRQLERRRNRRSTRTHVVLYADNHRPTVDRGLEPAVLKTLPVLIHSSESDRCQPECAVCLSEFEDNEVMRLLPKCNHSFHMECIDMWFHSHSTCPLCRAPVEPVVERNEPVEVELCATCQECEDDCTTSSSRGVGKGFEVRVDVATRRVELENELTQSSPTSRMLSFKRILSMGIRSPVGSRVTTPCRAGTSRGIGEVDLESGLRESTRVPTTPR